jgi:hypothetical protein
MSDAAGLEPYADAADKLVGGGLHHSDHTAETTMSGAN